jgi:hypothetical protein
MLLDPSELRENTDRYGGLSYNVVKWPVCQSVVLKKHDTLTHRPKHVGARILNKSVVQICALCWLFLLQV